MGQPSCSLSEATSCRGQNRRPVQVAVLLASCPRAAGAASPASPAHPLGQKEGPLRLPTQLEAADAPRSQAWWLNVWPAWPDSGQSTGRHPHGSQLGLPAARRTFRRL